MAPSTIIITGGTGSLGATVARTLETSYPGQFHILLACRHVDDNHAETIISFLTSKKASFSLLPLDLSDLDSVFSFVSIVKQQIQSGEIPPLTGGGIVNSAAYNTFFTGKKGKGKVGGGRDVMYTVNCLGPVLLERELLGEMLGENGATVVNVGSEANGIGRIDYFEGEEGGKEGEKVAFMEGMRRYGSCKLIILMGGFAFQRRVHEVSRSL